MVHYKANRSPALRALLKKSMLFTDEVFKFALVLFTMTIHTKHSLFSSASYHHTKQNMYLARSLRFGNSICGLTTAEECHYMFVSQVLCSIKFLAHVTFILHRVNIQLPVQKCLIQSCYAPSSTDPTPACIALRVPAPQMQVPAICTG